MNESTRRRLKDTCRKLPAPEGTAAVAACTVCLWLIPAAECLWWIFSGRMGLASGMLPLLLMGILILGLAVTGTLVPAMQAARSWKHLDDCDLTQAAAIPTDGQDSFLICQGLILNRTVFGPEAIRMNDAVWMYRDQAVSRRGKRRTCIALVTRDGRMHRLQGSGDCARSMERLAREVRRRKPHILLGYSQEREEQARKSFGALAALAEGRRDQTAGGVR